MQMELRFPVEGVQLELPLGLPRLTDSIQHGQELLSLLELVFASDPQ